MTRYFLMGVRWRAHPVVSRRMPLPRRPLTQRDDLRSLSRLGLPHPHRLRHPDADHPGYADDLLDHFFAYQIVRPPVHSQV